MTDCTRMVGLQAPCSPLKHTTFHDSLPANHRRRPGLLAGQPTSHTSSRLAGQTTYAPRPTDSHPPTPTHVVPGTCAHHVTLPHLPPSLLPAAGKLGAEGGAAAGAVVRAGSGVVSGAARMLDLFGCAISYDRKAGR